MADIAFSREANCPLTLFASENAFALLAAMKMANTRASLYETLFELNRVLLVMIRIYIHVASISTNKRAVPVRPIQPLKSLDGCRHRHRAQFVGCLYRNSDSDIDRVDRTDVVICININRSKPEIEPDEGPEIILALNVERYRDGLR